MQAFDWNKYAISEEDRATASVYLGSLYTPPDLVIAPLGEPYLFRWHIIRRRGEGNVYFHIQVASDPERPLHDHPWANMSVILSGGYDEIVQRHTPHGQIFERELRRGDVAFREAQEAHRLILPKGISYTMTQFATGPITRKWGFWYPEGFRPYEDVVENLADGRTVLREEAK